MPIKIVKVSYWKISLHRFVVSAAPNYQVHKKKVPNKSYESISYLQMRIYKMFCMSEIGKLTEV